MLFINILASDALVMPGFGLILTFTLSGVLNSAIVGAVAGIGEAICAVGDYFTDRIRRQGFFTSSNSSLPPRFNNIVVHHSPKATFFIACLINPIYYPFFIILGMLRFGWIRFFLATWAGRTVKNMAVAYLGYLGLKVVLRWLDVDI